MTTDWKSLSAALDAHLGLVAPALAITFTSETPDGVAPLDTPMPEPTADGRTGRAPAGCVFWMKGAERTFATAPEDHRNCSVGSYTHGLVSLQEAAAHADVAALLESGWVTEEMFPAIPAVAERPGSITYGPLRETPLDPDVVLLRLNAKQLMTMRDAIPEMRIEGKPQCHIIPLAKEHGEVAASVGCALSRVRTGMSAHETTCAIPAGRLGEVVERLEATAAADAAVARYAAEDSLRF